MDFLSARKQPKLLPPDAFSGLIIYKKFVCVPDPAGGAYSAPQSPSWIKEARFAAGAGGKGRGGGEEMKGRGKGQGRKEEERKGRERKGREGEVKRWRMVPQLLDWLRL